MLSKYFQHIIIIIIITFISLIAFVVSHVRKKGLITKGHMVAYTVYKFKFLFNLALYLAIKLFLNGTKSIIVKVTLSPLKYFATNMTHPTFKTNVFHLVDYEGRLKYLLLLYKRIIRTALPFLVLTDNVHYYSHAYR